MAVSYKGKKPSKLWYFRQRLAIAGSAFKEPRTRARARIMRQDALVCTAALALGVAIVSVPAAAALPLVTSIGPFVTGAIALWTGIKSFATFRHLAYGPGNYGKIASAEEAWLAKKSRPKFFARVKMAIKQKIAAIGYALTAPLRLVGLRKKSAPPALTQGATPVATPGRGATPSAQPQLSSAFDTPAQQPQPLTAEQEAAAARNAAARREARAARAKK